MMTLSNLPQKNVYKLFIKNKIRKAAFKSYLKLKERPKKKLKNVNCKDLGIQPYLNSNKFSISEKLLLFSLRSKCYPAQINLKKINKKDLKCVFKCDEEETQSHIFPNCEPF